MGRSAGAMRQPAGATGRAELRDELRATVDARRELGAGYEEFIIEEFLDRLERRGGRRRWTERKQRGAGVLRLFFSLLFAIPLTAIAGEHAGWVGVLIVWTALFLLNFNFRR